MRRERHILQPNCQWLARARAGNSQYLLERLPQLPRHRRRLLRRAKRARARAKGETKGRVEAKVNTTLTWDALRPINQYKPPRPLRRVRDNLTSSPPQHQKGGRGRGGGKGKGGQAPVAPPPAPRAPVEPREEPPRGKGSGKRARSSSAPKEEQPPAQKRREDELWLPWLPAKVKIANKAPLIKRLQEMARAPPRSTFSTFGPRRRSATGSRNASVSRCQSVLI